MAGIDTDRSAEATGSDSVMTVVYEAVRRKAVAYLFMPGERLNEGELAKELGVSRTPLREALNRLTTEGFLRSVAGKGFFFRELDPKEIFDLYELRESIELNALRLAVERAADAQIDALSAFVENTASDATAHETAELVHFDEHFHERIVEMSGNDEMLKVIKNLNGRIQFVRWIDVDKDHQACHPQGPPRHCPSTEEA